MIKKRNLTIQAKLILGFTFTYIIMFFSNFIMYFEVNQTTQRIDRIYTSNISLNELSDSLSAIHTCVYDYLNTKSSDALENYYRGVQSYRLMVDQLNGETVDNEIKIIEKNIKNMSDSYLVMADETVTAKRGRNTERYSVTYKEAQQLYLYINSYINELNNMQFKVNSNSYQVLLVSLKYLEIASSFMLVLVGTANLLILFIILKNVLKPLANLADKANEVAAGNFEVELLSPVSNDEVGVVTRAFQKMVQSIKDYIERLTDSMEKEQKMKERELLMETHLKDAQLKYLQAQIDPHFLFNSLNAGTQLAIMEEAEKTGIFIERMADFFRYNVRKMSSDTTLAEEIMAVGHYIYILNVRFAGDIHYREIIDESVTHIKVPSMILQPIVENAVNYGIRNVEWDGHICLTVRKEDKHVLIRVKDNGMGMTKERISEVLLNPDKKEDVASASTGVGLRNVISRLQLYYGTDRLLDIRSDGIHHGTEVILRLPLPEPEEVLELEK